MIFLIHDTAHLFYFNYFIYFVIFSNPNEKNQIQHTSTQQQLHNFDNPILVFILYYIWYLLYYVILIYIGICFLFIFSKTILYRPPVLLIIQPVPLCVQSCACIVIILLYIWFDNFILLCYCYNIYRLYILMMIFSIFFNNNNKPPPCNFTPCISQPCISQPCNCVPLYYYNIYSIIVNISQPCRCYVMLYIDDDNI